jgi:hypothetical protein
MSISNLLIIVAFVLFALGALGLPVGRFNLLSAGLACWLLSEILAAGILRL